MNGATASDAANNDTPNEIGSVHAECSICLQPYVQPVKLPCRHTFCYLCVKGIAQQSKRCAMCRQVNASSLGISLPGTCSLQKRAMLQNMEIPVNYLDNPELIADPESSVSFEGAYQWYYQGHGGWWQYDDRTSMEIEAAYKKGDPQCEVLIAGFLYVIDFQSSYQMRRSDPSRRRAIKRDLVSIPKLGIAGIRCSSTSSNSPNSDVLEASNVSEELSSNGNSSASDLESKMSVLSLSDRPKT